jgi:predicted CXXCH cytochrome family protein
MKAALLFLCLSRVLAAQDADTILLKNDTQKFTILSQIQDQAEAESFSAILRASDSAARNQLAAAFVKKYSQSWLLPQAYDVLARTGVDLDKYDQALADGRFSLRLVPENPSLLIIVANLEARKNDLEQAAEHATLALQYLDQIQRPGNMKQSEWNALRPEMKASAYFARARVAVSRDMPQNALNDLNRAAAWNQNDAEIFYLRGIVQIRLNARQAAAADLAFVYKGASSLSEKAKNILQVLSKPMPLQKFLSTLPARAVDEKLRQDNAPNSDATALAHGYAGPAACKSCHEKEYAAWSKTGMARMLQPYRQENIIGDFAGEYTEDSDTIHLGFDQRPYFEVKGARYHVDFTIGSKWQQAYATKLDDGRLQVLPIEYNLLQKKWINYWKMIDPPGSSRANIAEFPKLTPATNYQQNCAVCHTSQLKADPSLADPMQHAAYLQPGIDCEMCHGPSAFHVKHPDQPPLTFSKVSNRDGVRVCAQCHRQSTVREPGDNGEMNYSRNGNFVPAAWFMPNDAFSRRAFYKDGRFRETTFIVEAFTRSKCYLKGTAQCATCHSPHTGDFETNKTSLKFAASPNEMCLGCHPQYRNRIVEHTRHAAGSEAAQCVSCHMPPIMNALLFKARSHQIEIPTADLTQRFGQQESPNVCLSCHAEKDVSWAKEQLAVWPR